MGRVQQRRGQETAEGSEVTETIREIAEREAAEAEAEEEGTEETPLEGDLPEPEEGSEGEPEAAAPSFGAAMQEREKKLKSEDTRHENALKKIHGDEWVDFAMCPLCIAQGYLVPIPPGQQPDELWGAITALSGRIAQDALRHPDELVVCERCDGWGSVLSGAKNEHNATIPCGICEARGYFNLNDATHRAKLGIPAPPIEVPALAPVMAWPTPTPAEPIQTIAPPAGWNESGKPGADAYGRWPGHPRYGIDPSAPGASW